MSDGKKRKTAALYGVRKVVGAKFRFIKFLIACIAFFLLIAVCLITGLPSSSTNAVWHQDPDNNATPTTLTEKEAQNKRDKIIEQEQQVLAVIQEYVDYAHEECLDDVEKSIKKINSSQDIDVETSMQELQDNYSQLLGTSVGMDTMDTDVSGIIQAVDNGSIKKVLQTAFSYKGTPYVLGGASKTGIDCSGLTMRAYESIGISIPHKANKQVHCGQTVSTLNEAQPGDLIFYSHGGTDAGVYHVALYVGKIGGKHMRIHATTGSTANETVYGEVPPTAIYKIKRLVKEKVDTVDAQKDETKDQTSEKTPDKKNEQTNTNQDPSSTGSVKQVYNLTGIPDYALRTVTMELPYKTYSWANGTPQRTLSQQIVGSVVPSSKTGLALYKRADGTSDYLVATGSFFGKVGNRYRMTFANGTTATAIKVDEKRDSETDPLHRWHVTPKGGVLEFCWHSGAMPSSGNSAIYDDLGIPSASRKLVKMELIEGTITSSSGAGGAAGAITKEACLLYSAFSVSLDNMNVEYEPHYKETRVSNPRTGETVTKKEVEYYTQRDDSFTKKDESKEHIDPDDERVIYKQDDKYFEKTLRKKLKAYKSEDSTLFIDNNDSGNGFFKVSFVMDGNKPKVFSKTVTANDTDTGNAQTGTNLPAQPVSKTVYYVKPIIEPQDISVIAKDAFGIKDPKAQYPGAAKGITYEDMIENLNKAELEIIHDGDVSSTSGGSTVDANLSGTWGSPVKAEFLDKLLNPGSGSGFGPRNIAVAGASTYHQGIDVGMPTGTPCYAVQNGTVSAVGFNSISGNFVEVTHAGGVISRYQHLSKSLVKVGDAVTKGKEICLSGATGIGSGPHLHFAAKVNGKFVNPLTFLKK